MHHLDGLHQIPPKLYCKYVDLICFIDWVCVVCCFKCVGMLNSVQPRINKALDGIFL